MENGEGELPERQPCFESRWGLRAFGAGPTPSSILERLNGRGRADGVSGPDVDVL